MRLALLFLVGCSSPTPRSAPGDQQPPAAPSPAATATPSAPDQATPTQAAAPAEGGPVWVVRLVGPRTVWVDAQGNDVASQPFDVVAADGGLWAWDTEPVKVHACSCDYVDVEDVPGGAQACPEEDAGHTARLVDLVSGEQRSILDAPGPVVGEWDQGASLEASVGPFVSGSTTAWQYSCGAHGAASSAAWSLDLSGTAGDVLSDSERAAALGAPRQVARQVLSAIDPIESVDAVDLVRVVPRWEGTRLVVDLHFVADTCYACSDGLWSSYTASALVPMETLPAALSAWAEVPAPVAAWLAAHPGEALLGFGKAPAEQITAFVAARPLMAADPSGDYGDLAVLRVGEVVHARYSTVFGAGHLCACSLSGAAGEELRGDGLVVRFEAGRAVLQGSPGCCGAGWPGATLDRRGALASCAVAAERSAFSDRPGEEGLRRAYVVRGDVVEVLPRGESDGDWSLSVYRASGTSGWLKADTLDCR